MHPQKNEILHRKSQMQSKMLGIFGAWQVTQSPEDILEKLRAQNIDVSNIDETLKDIGKKNNRSPYELYKMISENTEKRKTSPDSLGPGSGIGRKTLDEVAGIIGGDVNALMDKKPMASTHLPVKKSKISPPKRTKPLTKSSIY